MPSAVSLALCALIITPVIKGQVVQWDIRRRELEQPARKVSRRAKTYEEVITNELARGGYFATTQVGTPGQSLTLQLDTGSSDIWVPSSSSSVCAVKGTDSLTGLALGCSLGAFNASSSTSLQTVSKGGFSISYVDGSYSKGDYITDTFEIAGARLNNVTMGLALKTDISYGLVGVGYALNEAVVADSSSVSDAYDNLPVQMVNEGMIATNAYSLWLNDLGSSTGNILFGGVDREKYVGDLTRVRVYKDPKTKAYTSFIVALTSLTAASSSGSDALSSTDYPIPVVLDSGTTFSYLPSDLAAQVWAEVGAVYSPEIDAAILPCKSAHSAGTFTFGFGGVGGANISVAMNELVLPLVTGGEPPSFRSGAYKGQQACQLGIQNFTSEPFLLGDTFLRSAYVVYDLENNEIGLARTDFNSTKTSVVAFESRGARIPNSHVAPNQDNITSVPGMAPPTLTAADGFAVSASASSTLPVLGLMQMFVIGASIAYGLTGSACC